MKILAIDPGPVKSAFVLYSQEEGIVDKDIWDNGCFPLYIASKYHNVMVVEMIASYGMPVGREVFETCLWIGRFLQADAGFDIDKKTNLVYRKDVKLHFCNSMKAKDSNIRQALLDRLGKEACKGVKKDIWSALAVALYFQDTRTKP